MKLSLPARDKVSRASFQLGLVFWFAQVLTLLSSWRYLPPQLPLFYSRPWGEEQLTSPVEMLILPGLSIGIILTNLAINLIVAKDSSQSTKQNTQDHIKVGI